MCSNGFYNIIDGGRTSRLRMKVNPVTTNFNVRGKGFNTVKPIGAPASMYLNPNPNTYHDYTKELRVALTNTIYNAGKGVGEHSVEGYAYIARFFNIKNFLALGGESAVFDLNDGNILKISVNKYHEYLPEFHAPELKRGVIKTSAKYKIFSMLKDKTTDTFYYVIQKKGQSGVSEEDQIDLIKKVREAGYNLEDVNWEQFAYFNINMEKQARFIDLGCIV